MSSKKIGDILKVNVPEFMQGMKHLDEYLEASGELLDDVRQDIDGLKKIKNYRESDVGLVDINLSELGFEVPVNIKVSVKRQVLRDLAEIHLRGGTEDGIRHLLRMVGIDAEMSRGWLLNPKMMREGWYRDYFTRETTRYSSNDRIYMDLLYGDVIDEDTGTMFEGYTYWDIDKEEKTGRLPIVGEVYDAVGTLGEDNVESTPYLIIRFEDDEIFLVDDKESIDPETGKVFPYTVNERFTLLTEIIQFFLVGEYRPTTMRIIVEAKLLDLEDSMNIAEKFKLQTTDSNRAPYADGVFIDEQLSSRSVATVGDTPIGDARIAIGRPSPIYSRWWGVDLKVGRNVDAPVRETWSQQTFQIHLDANSSMFNVPLLGECTINMESETFATVGVTGTLEDGSAVDIVSAGDIPVDVVQISVNTKVVPVGQRFITINRKVRDDQQ